MTLRRGNTIGGLGVDATRTEQVRSKAFSENRFFFGMVKRGKSSMECNTSTSKTNDLQGLEGSKLPSSSGEENVAENSVQPELIAGSEEKLQLLRKLVTKKNVQ